MRRLTSLEICAGVGGQALGLERAGFDPVMLIDEDPHSCSTLRKNRPGWDVAQMDLREFVASEHPKTLDVDLLSGGVPCTPYTVAGRRHGAADSRDLFTAAIWLVHEVRPRAVMIENVPRLLQDEKFHGPREFARAELRHLGYEVAWEILHAQDYGVPQRRPHAVLVAMAPDDLARFQWPQAEDEPPLTVGETLGSSMAEKGWRGACTWAEAANSIAPTIVGGSKKHGGADLGPTGTKRAWAELGVNGASLADGPPEADFVLRWGVGKDGREGLPKLTTEQVALLQSFPEDWSISGGKTARYRQLAQGYPPPVAEAVGRSIAAAFQG